MKRLNALREEIFLAKNIPGKKQDCEDVQSNITRNLVEPQHYLNLNLHTQLSF